MDILDGVRVIDLTMWAFVPSAGGVMAHWGADVIKVENPRSPDPMRLLNGSLEAGGAGWYFKHYSRGKSGDYLGPVIGHGSRDSLSPGEGRRCVPDELSS